MIRIGANPIGWSNDDMPELGGHIPLEQCLSEAKAAGFEGVELGNKFPRLADKLKPILDAHGLDLVGGWYSTFLAERDANAEMKAVRPHLDLLKGMGSTVFIAAECTRTIHSDRSVPLAQRLVLSEREWEIFTRNLSAFADRIAEEGLTLVYHHHMGTVVQIEPEIDGMMEACSDSVHLLLDTGHATWAGADPAALAQRWRGRIAHVHTKDVRTKVAKRAASENWSFLDAVVQGVYTVPGDGSIDFVSVFRELLGYSGWVVVEAEQDPEKAPPAKYAKMGHDNLVGFLRKASLMA